MKSITLYIARTIIGEGQAGDAIAGRSQQRLPNGDCVRITINNRTAGINCCGTHVGHQEAAGIGFHSGAIEVDKRRR